MSGVANGGKMARETMLGKDAGKFTLQLLGASNEARVQQYITEHAAVDDLYYIEMQNEGKPWFVVMQGEYDSKPVALLVYETFPNDVKQEREHAWARSFQSIQEVLVAN